MMHDTTLCATCQHNTSVPLGAACVAAASVTINDFTSSEEVATVLSEVPGIPPITTTVSNATLPEGFDSLR